MPEPPGRDAVVQHREVGRVEHGISCSGDDRCQDEPGVTVRGGERQRGERKQCEADEKRSLRSVAVDDESRQRLPHSGDDEEGGCERSGPREVETEIRHQPGKERGNDQMEEVRGRVREADQRHHLEVAGPHRDRLRAHGVVHRSDPGTTGFCGRSFTESWKTSGRA